VSGGPNEVSANTIRNSCVSEPEDDTMMDHRQVRQMR